MPIARTIAENSLQERNVAGGGGGVSITPPLLVRSCTFLDEVIPDPPLRKFRTESSLGVVRKVVRAADRE